MVSVFDNFLSVLKNKENTNNRENMFSSQFFIVLKNTENIKTGEQ